MVMTSSKSGVLIALILINPLCQAAPSQLCTSYDSCTGIRTNRAGSPCGTPCGFCVTIITNKRPECRQCTPNHFLNRVYQCQRCQGLRTNNEANVKRRCTDSIHTYNDIEQTANKIIVTPPSEIAQNITDQNASTATGSHQTITDAPSHNISFNESATPISTHHPIATNASIPEAESATADLGDENTTTTSSPPDPAKEGLIGLVNKILITGTLLIFVIVIIIVSLQCIRKYKTPKDEMEMQHPASPASEADSLLPPYVEQRSL